AHVEEREVQLSLRVVEDAELRDLWREVLRVLLRVAHRHAEEHDETGADLADHLAAILQPDASGGGTLDNRSHGRSASTRPIRACRSPLRGALFASGQGR